MDTPPLFKWRHFTGEIIVCGVRWYLRYALSYRDVEELMRERGVSVEVLLQKLSEDERAPLQEGYATSPNI
jgi:hypothetical protein